MTVQGDLNSQELRAVQHVIKQLSTVARHLASGDLVAASEAGKQIETSGSLAAVDLRVRRVQAVAVQQASDVLSRGRQDSPISEPADALKRPVVPTKGVVDSTREESDVGSNEFGRFGTLRLEQAEYLFELLDKFKKKLDRQIDRLTESIRGRQRSVADDEQGRERHDHVIERQGEQLVRKAEPVVADLYNSLAKADKFLNRTGEQSPSFRPSLAAAREEAVASSGSHPSIS
ncbi:MAG: hypothetical protein D6690_17375 [Nitrospirae bacterium]|nr:MAG: hypothetical protein D6690_17375 [Nitrospirota bacterium]